MKRVQYSDQNNNLQPAVIKPGLTSARFNFISLLQRIGVSMLALMLMFTFVVGLTNSASAAVKYSGLSVPEKASVYESALILQRCLVGKVGQVSEAAVKTGNVLGETNGSRWTVWDKTIINYHQTLKADDNVMNCSEYDNALVKGAINRLKIDPIDFVCSLGGERRDFNECVGGIGDFKYALMGGNGYNDANLIKYLKDKVGIDLNNPGNEVRYWRSYNIVSNYCASSQAVSKAVYDKESDNNRYTFKEPKTFTDLYFLALSKKDEKPQYKNTEQGDVNCGTYQNRVDQYFQDYKRYMDRLTPEEREDENQSQEDNQAPPATGDGTSCAIEGIGWIVCPVSTFIGGLNDGLWGILQNFLNIQPRIFDIDGDTFRIWSSVRNISNIAFVIVFLIIIYSQLTGLGVSNYGVKKMLPRLVIAAILVNVSFYVCTIAVDLSNILGYGIHSTLNNFAGGTTSNISLGSPVTSWSDVIAWLLAGGTGVLAGVGIAAALGTYGLWGALALLLPTALAALFAFLMVVVLLIARQAFVIILTVLAPLAFVAYLLPNTNQWFDRWRKFFITLLIMFPSIALLFGGSELAAGVIRAANPSDGLLIIASLAITALPLFALPALMKATGGIMNRIGGLINNPNRGPIDKMKRGGEAFAKRRGGQRSIQALNGNKIFGGRRTRRLARKEAIDSGIDRENGRSKNQYIASQLQTDADGTPVNDNFAKQVAGGSAGRYGPDASPDAITRALAGAKLTIDKAVAEEVEAEGVMVRNFNLDKLKTDLKTDRDGRLNGGPVLSEAQRSARVQRLIQVGDAKDFAGEIDDVIKNGSETVRRSTARALASDGPKWFKGSDIDAIATGSIANDKERQKKGTDTFEGITRANIRTGVMSPEKIVEETGGNLKYAMDVTIKNVDPATGKNEAQLLVNAAAAAKASPTLSVKIKHNADSIDAISRGTSPN